MDEDMVVARPNIPRVSVRTQVANEYNIRLARDISCPDDFSEELMCLNSATENDLVRFDIVSGGGRLDTCVMIRRAMSQCPAKIIGWIGPTCASAASAIALQCDAWEIDEMSSFMVHTGSFGPRVGKSPDVVASTLHTAKMLEKFVRSVYTGFLTDKEIEQVLDGKELYFEGEELATRLEAYAEYRDSLQEETSVAA